MAKEFNPEYIISTQCDMIVPLTAVDVKIRLDLDNFKTKSFYFSILDVPGNMDISYTFCCKTSTERDRWVERVSQLSNLAIDVLELQSSSETLRKKLFSAKILLRMNVGEKLLENFTNGNFSPGSRKYEEVKDHLDEYFEIFKAVMTKKAAVHRQLIESKQYPQTEEPESNRSHNDAEGITHAPSEEGENESADISSKLNKIFKKDIDRRNPLIHRNAHTPQTTATTSDLSSKLIRIFKKDDAIGRRNPPLDEAVQPESSKSLASPGAMPSKQEESNLGQESENVPSITSNTKSSVRTPGGSIGKAKNITGESVPKRTSISEIMRNVLVETGGKFPADKAQKSVVLKKIIAEIKKNPNAKYDLMKVSEALAKFE